MSHSENTVSDSDSSPTRVVRVLALHGSEGTGPEFTKNLQPLWETLLGAHQEVRVEITSITATFPKGDGFAWWSMPPGVRSFNAKEYQGFETSASLLLYTLQQDGPFDVLLGHSQGAILTAALLALHRIPNHPKLGYILNGVAVPNPFAKELEQLKMKDEAPRILFVLGENDKINPKSTGEAVMNFMERAGARVTACCHPGGHSVPVNDEVALESISNWIAEGFEG